MLKYFVWVVRDLISTGIVFALILALTKLRNAKFQKKGFFTSLIIGLVGAIILAAVEHYNVVRDKKLLIVNVILLGTILVSSLIYMIFNLGVLSKKLPTFHGLVVSISGGLFLAPLLAYKLPNVLLYPFHFLIKGQSIFSTDYLFKLIGFLLAAVLVFLTILILYKILVSLPIIYVKVFSIFIILLNGISLFPYMMSPMIVRRWIRVSKSMRKLVVWLYNHTDFFSILMIAISFVAAITLFYFSLHNTEPYSNPAEHRKIRAKCRNQRRYVLAFVIFYALTVIDLTALQKLSKNEVKLSAAEPFEIEGDIISIPLEQVSDGVLHRFEYKTSDDVGIRFIVIQKNAFSFGIGFDACEICGATGYYQKNGQVICKLCDVVMNINTIGFKGGCNPIPLPYEIVDGIIRVNVKDLEVEKKRFR